MVIQVLRKKSKDDSKEIANLKYENEDLQCCLMSSMEGVDSLKKQIQELKKNNKHSASSEVKSETEDIYLSVVKEENLKLKTDVAGLKSSIKEFNSKLLETGHQNDALQKSNLSFLKKVDLLKDQVKEQLCKASKAEFEVESFRRYNKDLVQKLQSLQLNNNNNSLRNATASSDSFDNNISNNSYGQHYQGFGSPNVSIYKKTWSNLG